MAKKAYIGISVIPNPPPIKNTSGWLANQSTTVSVNGTALRVVSNQTSSTPGVYTDLLSSIPSGTYVTLDYTMRGNVSVSASLWNTSSSSGVLATPYYSLTSTFQTFSISGTLSSIVSRLYFFMTNPTTSSWFEVGEIHLSYGKARKIKKGYIGVNGVARKIKKAYIGIGGVARPCWSGGELAYYGTATALSGKRFQLAATSIGSYALFGGGKISYDGTDIVDTYNSSLTHSTATQLSLSRYSLAAAKAGSSYALFGGGYDNSDDADNTVDAYNSSLTRSTSSLSGSRADLAATSIGSYALFGGGKLSSYALSAVDAFNTSLTRSTATELSLSRYGLAAAKAGSSYALFGGGYEDSTMVDAYNSSLTKSNPTGLSVGRQFLAATSVGNYALFGGGYYDFSYSSSGNYVTNSNAVDAYNTSLTRSTATALSTARFRLAATTVDGYALFGGGDLYYPASVISGVVDAYNSSLTRTTTTALSPARYDLAATSVGNYALFGGGDTYYHNSSDVVNAYTVT